MPRWIQPTPPEIGVRSAAESCCYPFVYVFFLAMRDRALVRPGAFDELHATIDNCAHTSHGKQAHFCTIGHLRQVGRRAAVQYARRTGVRRGEFIGCQITDHELALAQTGDVDAVIADTARM